MCKVFQEIIQRILQYYKTMETRKYLNDIMDLK